MVLQHFVVEIKIIWRCSELGETVRGTVDPEPKVLWTNLETNSPRRNANGDVAELVESASLLTR
jgi:hypothetical protein